ncbi:MAG: cupin domain-containing protein [Acidimicrobiia bacterium]
MGNMHLLHDLPPKPVWEGVAARIVEGERITLAVMELDPDTLVPEHSHQNEQIGIVVTGSIRFTVDGEEQELGPGGSWRILSGVPHEALSGPSGAVVVDVFSPIRSDWRDIEDEEPRIAPWPPA